MSSTCNAVRLGTIGAVLAGFALIASPAQADRVEKHFPVQGKPMVTVRNASGKIQVKAWNKNEVQVAWTNAGGKAVVERLCEVVEALALRARPLRDSANGRQHVVDAML